mgnify:CR=1 FL=1
MAFDHNLQRVVAFGGNSYGSTFYSDLISFDGLGWQGVAVAAPSRRSDVGLAFDASRDRLIMIGGYAGSGVVLGDTWEFDGIKWIPQAGPAPSPRFGAAQVFAPELGGAVMFGPVAGGWAPRAALAQALGNPEATPGRAGGAAPTGAWRVVALVDLTAPETFGTGDAALDRRLAETLGGSAMLLERVDGAAAPMLLHGIAAQADGSIGGIALTAARFGELAARLGNPEGLAVEVLRRRVQRAGWGGERGRRRRAG